MFRFRRRKMSQCAHYFINLMKHFMHCWKYFSYIFSILLSSWFMLSSSGFSFSLPRHTEQPNKIIKLIGDFFLAFVFLCIHFLVSPKEDEKKASKSEAKSGSDIFVLPMSNIRDSEMEPIARLYCLGIDRWGLIRSTVKNHDSQSEADVEKRKSCKWNKTAEKWSKKNVFQRLRKR